MANVGWFTEWGTLTKEWVIGAFCAATLDWVASKVPLQPGLIATLFSTAQLAASMAMVSGLSGIFGIKSEEELLSQSCFAVVVIWAMSPTATSRLMSGYTRFHRILYGTSPIPTYPAGNACADGKCGEQKLVK